MKRITATTIIYIYEILYEQQRSDFNEKVSTKRKDINYQVHYSKAHVSSYSDVTVAGKGKISE